MAERPHLAQDVAGRIAALRTLLEQLETEGRSEDPAARAVRELLAEATGTGDDGPDAPRAAADLRPS